MRPFYLREAGRIEGPFDPAEVKRRLLAGGLSHLTMSWQTGEKNWCSLGRRWPDKRARHSLVEVSATLLVLALVFVAVGVPGRLYVHLPYALQTRAFVLVSAGVALAAALMLSFMLIASNRRLRARASLPTALCVMLIVVGGMMSAGLCGQIVQVIDLQARLPNASIDYDEANHAIRIRGEMGHYFSSDLADSLSKHRDVQMIVISSPGGLSDQSFAAADVINRARLPLRLDGDCASACGLMWATVARRQMTASSRVGLHQNRMAIEVPSEVAAAGMKKLEDKSVAVLISAGFTSAMLAERAATPPEKIFWLNAVDITAAGIDAAIVDESGHPVSSATAKWEVLGLAFGRGSQTARLYQSIAQHQPALVGVYEDRLYNALQTKNMALFQYENVQMQTAALRQAITEVRDEDVMNWARLRQIDLAEAVRDQSSSACNVLIGRADPGVADAARKRVIGFTLARNIRLEDGIPAAFRFSLPVDTSASANDYAAYAHSVSLQVKQEGYPANPQSWTNMQRCSYEDQFLRGLASMPLARGAGIVRFVESGRRVH